MPGAAAPEGCTGRPLRAGQSSVAALSAGARSEGTWGTGKVLSRGTRGQATGSNSPPQAPIGCPWDVGSGATGLLAPQTALLPVLLGGWEARDLPESTACVLRAGPPVWAARARVLPGRSTSALWTLVRRGDGDPPPLSCAHSSPDPDSGVGAAPSAGL